MGNILKGIINEVGFPEDPEEYDAMLGGRGRRPRPEPDYPEEPEDPYADYNRKQDAADKKYRKDVNVQYVNKEGMAPNGERYNGAFIVHSKTPQQGDHEVYKFNDVHWGAKKIVDTVKKKPESPDGAFVTVVYYVDNHKHGYWTPFKGEPPISKGISFSEELMREGISQDELANVLLHRLETRYPDVVSKYPPEAIESAAMDVARFHAGAEELGSSDINIMLRDIMRQLENYIQMPNQLDELSPETLARYKTAAGADARAADKEGDYKRGDKRFSGIVRATKKEFEKAAQNLSEDELFEMAYDTMNHPKYGKLMWMNYGGAHIIARKEPNGALKIFVLGTHKEIANKWKSIKDKLAATQPSMGMMEDWQKVNKSDKTDGMSRKAVKAYRRENPGSKLKTAVTTKPSKLKKGSKDAKRRKSFCARMKGMKKAHASAKTKRNPDSPINKALRRWNCESVEELHQLAILAEQKLAEAKKSLRTYNPCEKKYKPIGTKEQDGRTVPNCVPKESAIMKGLVDENLGGPYPGTYEQETAAIKIPAKQERVQKIAFEGKK